MAPNSVAVIGASERYESPGSVVILNMLSRKFAGSIYPINPKYETIHGISTFKSVSELPEKPDCVLICVNANMVPHLLREAAKGGAGSAVIYASGFTETGQDGATLQAEIKEISEEFSIPFCGPNCIGPVNFLSGFGGFSANLPSDYSPCNVSAVCQSGSVAIALLNSGRGIDFRYLVSSGNEASVTIEDYFEFLIKDDGTKVVLGFVESFKNIPKLKKVAALARERGKIIALVKIGRTAFAQRTVISHTGALAGEDKVIDALLKKIGIVRAGDLNELLEVGTLFRGLPAPTGKRVGMVAISGGEIGLLSDLCADIGIQLPELENDTIQTCREILPPYSPIANPLDAWGNGDLGETFQNAITAIGQDSGFDSIVVCLDVQAGMSDKQANYYAIAANSIVEASRSIDKPLVVFSNLSGGVHPKISTVFDEANVPILQGTTASLAAIRYWVDSGKVRSPMKLPDAPAQISQAILPAIRENGIVAEYAAMAFLRSCGISVNEIVLTSSLAEANSAADQMGYPVALKVDSSGISHKSKAGAVALNINKVEELETAYEQILANANSAAPEATINGVTVQKMIDTTSAVEILAGITVDPQCGPAVIVGMGGVFTEVLNDTAIRLAPFSKENAEQMLQEIRGAPLLENADKAAIIEVLLKLSSIAVEFQNQISQMDINPLLVFSNGDGGAVAVDALITMKGV